MMQDPIKTEEINFEGNTLLEEEEEAMMESSEYHEDDSLAFNDSSAGLGMGSRQWQKDNSNNAQASGYNISVGITTRDESLPIYDTPCKMYSSLRYKLHYKCSVNAEQVTQLPKLLMCRITVIDDDSDKEIKKDNKPIIDDSLISLKNTSTANGNFGVFEANHKVKFRSVSFHHNKSKWRLLLQLFSDSNHNINTPVFVMRSAPFQVYARRPKVSERDSSNGLLNPSTATASSSQTTTKEEKRKKKAVEGQKKRKRSIKEVSVKQEVEATESTEPTTTEQSTTSTAPEVVVTEEVVAAPNPKKVKLMETFKKTLDLLIKHHSEMDEEDKLTGFHLIQHRLFQHFYGCTPEQLAYCQQQQECETAEVMQSGSADDLITIDTSSLFEPTESNETSMTDGNFSMDAMDFIGNQSLNDDFTSFM
ncbi:predicted protein [Naegleria gruberi]|uniref:Predicted protein n=1 Tax=Naegleria gruberi TaxID=5762 RepID=D2VQ60_NAEGR|nr:uncharacterized protein NAEGRDRAFT_58883 [Naegleria gruberi]EFC41050.1 predicted protein [Naegleria gruberi]|eukprot:XP_002673794.1 predicted protein [Naegleria gruberi strain NEG-M]